MRYADGMLVLAGVIDNSGYSSDIREKYQAYLISEVTLDVGGKKLGPGAYGVGFVQGKFVVTDLGAHDLAQGNAARDAEIKQTPHAAAGAHLRGKVPAIRRPGLP